MASPLKKDDLVNLTKHGGGVARVKPVKNIGNGTQTITIKNYENNRRSIISISCNVNTRLFSTGSILFINLLFNLP